MILLILFAPLISFLICTFFGSFIGKWSTIFLTTSNILIACVLSLFLLFTTFNSNCCNVLFISSWISCDQLQVSWELMGDTLTFFMCFIVTFISLLVHIYSSEYMKNDPHIIRFFIYLSLFTFFMLILITAANFIQMFVGWEGVGLSSYLLINFWFTRLQANKAAIKAMLFNRIADMFMLLGLFGIYVAFETYDYVVIFSIAPLYAQCYFNLVLVLDFICIFLFLGAMGKSAQLGFHNWLPDAMEGPTPVSALIHAATMVTAGIFLIIRCSYLFEFSVVALNFIAIIGALTAFFGATTGLFFHDLKRVIAFSTCSQLGYMILACGLSRFNIAFFHLVTHAFFKALLFLTAGAIIHSLLDEQDIRKFGSLIKYLPLTYISFLIGSLNLIGFPFLSGFYSKDLLLELIYVSYTNISFFCYFFGLLSIFFTSSYSTRIIILIFLSKSNFNRYFTKNMFESSFLIKYSLILLSLLSIIFGFFCYDCFSGLGSTFFGTSFFFNIYIFNASDIEFLNPIVKLIPLVITLLGGFFSFFFYLYNVFFLLLFKNLKVFKYVYKFFLKKWYSDRFVNEVFGLPLLNFCKFYVYNNLDRGLLELYGPSFFSVFITRLKIYVF